MAGHSMGKPVRLPRMVIMTDPMLVVVPPDTVHECPHIELLMPSLFSSSHPFSAVQEVQIGLDPWVVTFVELSCTISFATFLILSSILYLF